MSRNPGCSTLRADVASAREIEGHGEHRRQGTKAAVQRVSCWMGLGPAPARRLAAHSHRGRASARPESLRGHGRRDPYSPEIKGHDYGSPFWRRSVVKSKAEQRRRPGSQEVSRRGAKVPHDRRSRAGRAKPPPYANATPVERLAAAVRLMAYQSALLERPGPLPRSEWPGEKFKCGDDHG